MEEIFELRNQLLSLEERQKINEERIASFGEDSNEFKAKPDYEDIEPEIASGDQIQLESYKAIPEFSGLRGQYRPWRSQVARRMKLIDNFKSHPKYEAALAIIRAKITGAASNVLTNNKTAYNIKAILVTLDSSFADHRPLYVVEAEMTSIKQLGKTLQEYHDAINQALNMVITKIVYAYKLEAEQSSLVTEAQRKAVRTFIVGLNNETMRHILYGRTPGTLAEAFTIAQTVYYDQQYTKSQSNQSSKPISPKFNQNYNKQIPYSTQPGIVKKFEPMTVNENTRENWRRSNLQQPFQKINQLQDNELNANDDYDGNICGGIPDDLASNTIDESDTASAFLSA